MYVCFQAMNMALKMGVETISQGWMAHKPVFKSPQSSIYAPQSSGTLNILSLNSPLILVTTLIYSARRNFGIINNTRSKHSLHHHLMQIFLYIEYNTQQIFMDSNTSKFQYIEPPCGLIINKYIISLNLSLFLYSRQILIYDNRSTSYPCHTCIHLLIQMN